MRQLLPLALLAIPVIRNLVRRRGDKRRAEREFDLDGTEEG